MPTGRDDDALSWGDEDPTLEVGSRAERPASDAGEPELQPEPVALPEGYTAVGRGSETITPATEAGSTGARSLPESAETPAMGNTELISLGVLGGFSVLYAVGWLIGGLRLQGTAEFLVAPLAYQVSLWLAVAAPLVWFATVLLLTRGRRLWVRFAWLAGGVLLLVPWPFIMVGAIGR